MWVQCLNPPLPEDLGLALKDPSQMTAPIEFNDNVTYVCANNALFFEHDNKEESFKIQCYDDGTFGTPNTWPRCIESNMAVFQRFLVQYNYDYIIFPNALFTVAVTCPEPPEKPYGGTRLWRNKENNYLATI